jgi:ABC-type proline/glycine betaine transport system ATPase subunit
MKKNSVILLIGACGSGKTWVMKKLINEWGLKINGSMGLIKFKTNKKKCKNILI